MSEVLFKQLNNDDLLNIFNNYNYNANNNTNNKIVKNNNYTNNNKLNDKKYNINNYEWLKFHDYSIDYNDNLVKVVELKLDYDVELNITYENYDKYIDVYLFIESQVMMHNLNKKSCYLFYNNINNKSKIKILFNNNIMKNSIKYLHNYWLKMNLDFYKSNITISGVKRNRHQIRNNSIILNNKIVDHYIDNKKFISASKLKNYILDDTICDWFDEYGKQNINNKKDINQQKNNLCQILFDNGNKFEEYIIKKISKKIHYVKVAHNNQDSLNFTKFLETVSHMNNGVPLIYQGVLHNNLNNTFGMPDIIIRSDYLNLLTNTNIIDKNELSINANLITNKGWHYRIIDIKNITVYMGKNGEYILNNNKLTKFYKSQLYLYNYALGIIQGYIPPSSYILGKKYVNKSQNIKYNWDENIGKINFLTNDKYIKDLHNKAISWIKLLRKNGENWDINNPHIIELLPNMNNKYDSKWYNEKHQLLKNNCDITELWMCNNKNKLQSINNNIKSWRNQKCSPKELGISSQSKYYNHLDLIIKMNQNEQLFQQSFDNNIKNKLIYPNIINNNINNWKLHTDNDIYIDFECINKNFLNYSNNMKTTNILFMIGVWYKNNDEWNYKNFVMSSLSEENEKINIINFLNFLNNFKNIKLFHWGNYEKRILSEKCLYYDIKNMDYEFIDILKIFKNEPIVIRGSLNFSLKSVANAFYNNKFISIIWDKKNPISNGETSLIYSNKLYDISTTNIQKNKILSDITEYNNIDCRVMFEIINHLRKYHV
jgi:hypothetical protein